MTQAPVDIVDQNRARVVVVAEDRCDARACGAKAYVYARFPTGSVAYCGHHGTEYMPALIAQGGTVIDLRYQLEQ